MFFKKRDVPQGAAYEKVWHLVVPPVMTLLDDYELKYKLRGVQIVDHLLINVPGELLRRTGISGLFYSVRFTLCRMNESSHAIQSFKTCLTFFRSPESPALIHSVVPASLTLIEKTTLPASTERFDQLWGILGDGIIETVWLYGFEEAESVKATLDVLADVIKALGIGCARYLKVEQPSSLSLSGSHLYNPKVLVSQLVLPLVPAPENPSSASFQLSAVRALMVLIEECAPRMGQWKSTILDGVCRRWVNLIESGTADDSGKSASYGHYELIGQMERDRCS